MTQPDLTKTWVHLGTGGTAIPQPDFDGDVDWFQDMANVPSPMVLRVGWSPCTLSPNPGRCGKPTWTAANLSSAPQAP